MSKADFDILTGFKSSTRHTPHIFANQSIEYIDVQGNSCVCRGKKLDELHKAVEVGKRPYQNILKIIIGAIVTAAVCILIGFMMHIFLN